MLKMKEFGVKFHFKTKQGIKNFTDAEATKISGENPDFAQEDLCTAIENGDFPKSDDVHTSNDGRDKQENSNGILLM